MRTPLLRRYLLDDDLVEGRAVPAQDLVLDRPVDVVLLPAGEPAGRLLQRLRHRVSSMDEGGPRILDLAVVDGRAVAFLLADSRPAAVEMLVRAADPQPAPPVELRRTAAARPDSATPEPATNTGLVGPGHPTRSAGSALAAASPGTPSTTTRPYARAGGAVAAAVGAVLVLGLLTALDGDRDLSGGASSAPAAPSPAASPTAPAPPADVPPTKPSTPAVPTPDEAVVLLLASVRDDPGVGPAAPRLLRLLRGLDAEQGPARTELANRTLQFADEQVRVGRLRPDVGTRTADTMRRVLAESGGLA